MASAGGAQGAGIVQRAACQLPSAVDHSTAPATYKGGLLLLSSGLLLLTGPLLFKPGAQRFDSVLQVGRG